jgi:hypothetical protein
MNKKQRGLPGVPKQAITLTWILDDRKAMSTPILNSDDKSPSSFNNQASKKSRTRKSPTNINSPF